MGFWRKTPPQPEPNDNLGTVSPSHQHTWYDDQGHKHSNTCNCDTGQNHTTPRAE